MTDLTPEQVEKWAGDERGKGLFEAQLRAISNTAPIMMYGGEAYLYAHALHLQQQATIERLGAELQNEKERSNDFHRRAQSAEGACTQHLQAMESGDLVKKSGGIAKILAFASLGDRQATIERLEAENARLTARLDVARDLIGEVMYQHSRRDGKCGCAWCDQARRNNLIDHGWTPQEPSHD